MVESISLLDVGKNTILVRSEARTINDDVEKMASQCVFADESGSARILVQVKYIVGF